MHADGEGVHLRWFITSDEIRGGGAGTALLSAAMGFCKTPKLPTSLSLDLCRAEFSQAPLLEKFGFRLVHQQRGAQWGLEVDEQRFELGEAGVCGSSLF